MEYQWEIVRKKLPDYWDFVKWTTKKEIKLFIISGDKKMDADKFAGEWPEGDD